ncbi:4Fe-4S dicluster domain-containing protein [Roseinatronobacter sp. S2]|uniref:4Fe-4S dicluster domain-containing protein n=1 Tax=Roseinatronobacter sp. S2 TaxID=3035471 RepID=UPI00240ED851|nr:4Fe-4S dicluster domain-containing protein [Roseinatronobacter sp. S2]WFE75321.1 4Fe-4S dicluster domain-containing protein [Roseinatronobacter sp. S2]
MTKWGMVIDLDKCTGCQACTTACAMENNTLPGENWQDVLYYSEGTYPTAKLTWLPRPCMQCENPSCVAVCPTKATYKDMDAGGIVFVDWNKCIGCKYCMIACPYGVRFYADEKPVVEPDIRDVFPGEGQLHAPPYQGPESDSVRGIGIQPKGVVSKCTFCYHKVSKAPEGVADLDEDNPDTKEYTPACVRTCPPKARYFGDLDNPESEVNRLIADQRGVRLKDHTGNRPQVYYLGSGADVPAYQSPKKT